jgi:prepilin-type N-terminal cleavage/methylation domain-containing protein
MPAVRRARAFTLIEAMIVVVLVGLLAVVAGLAYRKWVQNSYVGEAQGMLGNIRSAEETFLAENTGYLGISNDLTAASLYPSINPTAAVKTEWGLPCGTCVAQWTALNVNPNAPVRFGYAVIADNSGTAAPADVKNDGAAVSLAAMVGKPWYVAEAICDIDSDSTTTPTTLYAVSGDNRILVNNEGQ